MAKKGGNSGSFRSRANPVARDLRTPKYRMRVVRDKRRELEEGAADQEIEEGLSDHEEGGTYEDYDDLDI